MTQGVQEAVYSLGGHGDAGRGAEFQDLYQDTGPGMHGVRGAGVDVAIGVAERDAHSRSTIYATLLFIGSEGKMTSRRRVVFREGNKSEADEDPRASISLNEVKETPHSID